ncbi:RsmD family RNA methyltransferase [Mucisphaera calidilacus]|uniref:Ribosomal RNA small subunit methyltransferase D n=1 Tax=Mucisphaera calidilacus TaxID=2527982 RepID=A0A518BYD0_9BACT|nr:RsmD family RNA methyltransferase [Mucisphaera calidilacus]QDU71983.1 Ribosomal RNA small subunit methyltransferase D [Mucisphaera calidilacus]
MRVIAGSHKHRRLLGPPDAETTRPITDRVKQALFDRLTALGLLGDTLEQPFGPTLDLFAGTGSLGIEALSRGSTHCTFVEADRRIQSILRDNLEQLGLADRATIVHGSALLPLWIQNLPDTPVALVFLDPPYKLMDDPDAVERLLSLMAQLAPRLEPGGIINLRTPKQTPTPPEVDGLDGPVSLDYGSMTLHLYQTPLDDENDA